MPLLVTSVLPVCVCSVESRANRAISIIAKIESKDVLPNIVEIVEVRQGGGARGGCMSVGLCMSRAVRV